MSTGGSSKPRTKSDSENNSNKKSESDKQWSHPVKAFNLLLKTSNSGALCLRETPKSEEENYGKKSV